MDSPKPLFDVSPCEESILRLAMRHFQSDQPGEFFHIWNEMTLTYARSLELKGFGSVYGTILGQTAGFKPNEAATAWLKDQPLNKTELFVLGYYAGIRTQDAHEYRDPGLGYPEFRGAAHSLQVHGLGTYQADAVDEVDPYFIIKDEGRQVANLVC